MRKLICCLGICLLTACTPMRSDQPSVARGFSSALLGLAHLVLSPFQIAAGLLEGIASVPYYLSTSVHDINSGMMKASARLTLEDTYESAYGTSLQKVAANGETGVVFQRMKNATTYFQKILQQYGVPNSQAYILTSVDTANDQGYTLLAVVYRPMTSIQVMDKYHPNAVLNLQNNERLFYEPYRVNTAGKALDTVIDWAAVPRDSVQTQKGQAVLLTLAANAVINEKRSADYWAIEQRWIAGEARQITEQRLAKVQQRMGITKQ